MTLIATNPGFPVAPPSNFAEVFKSWLLQEAKARIEEICREVLSSLDSSMSPSEAPVGAPDNVDGFVLTTNENASETSRRAEHKVSEPLVVLPTRMNKHGGHPAAIAGNKRNTLSNVIPRMMMLDADFGGNLSSDEVCRRFKFTRKRYHEYKKTALAIWRCYKIFGGQMNYDQTARAAHISNNTMYRYVKIMKEGFNAGNQ